MTRPPRSIRLYGHRGAPGEAPENTSSSFRRARALGADGVELDVQLTADGWPVVLHDDTLDRTTSGSGPVRDATLGQVQALSAGAWRGPAWQGEHVPTLAEVLVLAAEEGLALDVELKETPAPDALVDAVVRTLVGGRWAGPDATGGRDLLVTSFDARLLRGMRRALPEVALGYLLEGIWTPDGGDAWLANTLASGRDAGATVFLPSLDLFMAAGDVWPADVVTIPYCGPAPATLPLPLAARVPLAGFITDEPHLFLARSAAGAYGPALRVD